MSNILCASESFPPSVRCSPNAVTARVVGFLRADGLVDTTTRVTTLFTNAGTSSANFYRTVTSADGNGVYATGQTSTANGIGMQYTVWGNTTSRQIVYGQATNQRYAYVGPSFPGNPYGQSASQPMLYLSYANPLNLRGIHYMGAAGPLPTTNVTTGTVLVPGFSKCVLALLLFMPLFAMQWDGL